MSKQKKPIPASAQHWNNDLVCVIDTETTGLNFQWNEIIQIAVLPLNSRFEIRRDIIPLNLTMKPDHPERVEAAAMAVNKKKATELMAHGHSQQVGLELFQEWFEERLNPPYKKGGLNRCRIIPLGQNYLFDQKFIEQWMGHDMYDELFHYHYRDLMHLCLGINDAYSAKGETVPFSKVKLSWICKILGVVNPEAHDALGDVVTTGECYRKVLTQFSSVLAS